jgi:hypothetical protein
LFEIHGGLTSFFPNALSSIFALFAAAAKQLH